MRLIEADKLALKLRHMGYMDEHEEVQEVIDEAPTIDAVERIEYEKMKDLAEQYKFEYECIFEAHKEVLNEVLPNRVEAVRSKWVEAKEIGDCCYTCLNCGFVRDAYLLDTANYCPNCGAKMEEEE